jgi:hypothetical protein
MYKVRLPIIYLYIYNASVNDEVILKTLNKRQLPVTEDNDTILQQLG